MDINNIARCLFNTTFISDNRKPKDRVVIPTTAGAPDEAVLLTGQGLSTQASEGGLGLVREDWDSRKRSSLIQFLPSAGMTAPLT